MTERTMRLILAFVVSLAVGFAIAFFLMMPK